MENFEFEPRKIWSKEECRRLELDGFANPTRRVTLVDGSQVIIDRVTGLPFLLEVEFQKKEQRQEKYRQYLKTKYQLEDLNLKEEN